MQLQQLLCNEALIGGFPRSCSCCTVIGLLLEDLYDAVDAALSARAANREFHRSCSCCSVSTVGSYCMNKKAKAFALSAGPY